MRRNLLAVVFIATVFPVFVSAATIEELQAQLQVLLYQVSALRGQEQTLGSPISQPTRASCPILNRNLSRGSRGDDIRQLQQFLISQDLLAADSPTGFFGALTERAVQQFQCRKMNVCAGSSVSNGYGAVGPRTRAQIGIGCVAQKGLRILQTPPIIPNPAIPGFQNPSNTTASTSIPATSIPPVTVTSPLPQSGVTSAQTTGTQKLSQIGIKSVAEYGAVGDGTTDDSDAFIRALAAENVLFVPGGKTYRISKQINLPKSATIFSDKTATIKMVGSANLLIGAPFIRIRGINFDAQSTASCVFTLNTNAPAIYDAKLRIEDINASGPGCFYNEMGSGQYFDVDFRNITITNARGTQFNFASNFAYLQMADISISAASGLAVPFVRISNNQGAWISNIAFSGASANAGNHGFSISNSIALWLIGVRAQGIGGSGIYGQHVDALYMRNLAVDSAASCIDMQDGDRLLGSTFSGSACAENGIKLSNVRRSVVTAAANTVPSEPATLMAMRGFDVYRSLLNDSYVSVAAYGAKGNGVTDDSAAFAQAIASGKNVYVPYSASGYRLANTVNVNRAVAIVAPQPVFIASAAHTAFNISASGVTIGGFRGYAPSGDTTASFTALSGTSLSNITLQDFYLQNFAHILDNGSVPVSRLNVENVMSYTPTDTSFTLNNVQDSSLRRVTVSNSGASKPASFMGITLRQPSNVLIRESTVGGYGVDSPSQAGGGLSLYGGSNVYLSQFHADTTTGHGLWVDATNGVFAHELISGLNDLTDMTFTNSTKNVQGINSLIYGRVAPLTPDSSAIGVRALQGSLVNFSNIIIVDHAKPHSVDSSVSADTTANHFITTLPSAPQPSNVSTGLSATCSANGTQATFSWISASGAPASSGLRVNDTANESTGCASPTVHGPNESCVAPTDYVNESAISPITLTVPAGHLLSWWVHSLTSAGIWGEPTFGASLTCTSS